METIINTSGGGKIITLGDANDILQRLDFPNVYWSPTSMKCEMCNFIIEIAVKGDKKIGERCQCHTYYWMQNET